MTKGTKFIVAIAVQVTIIFVMILFKLSVLSSGTEVMLRIMPVDPRDMLRGDYATFQYQISNVSAGYNQKIMNGDTVYVQLSQSAKYYYANSATKVLPSPGALFIKGKVLTGGIEAQDDLANFQKYNNSFQLRIVYGIEQYFIPDGAGRNFSFRDKEVAAQVAIDEYGNAVLKRLYVDEKLWP